MQGLLQLASKQALEMSLQGRYSQHAKVSLREELQPFLPISVPRPLEPLLEQRSVTLRRKTIVMKTRNVPKKTMISTNKRIT